MDVLDRQHMAMHPVLLGIFAVWNGYGSWTGLRAVVARQSARPHQDAFRGPGP